MSIDDFKKLDTEEAWAEASRISGIPVNILNGVWAVESGKGKNMLSHAGAEGHFQIMPKTRATMEGRVGRSIDPYDFHDSLYTAALLLKENKDRFGSTEKALKAYNGGWNPATWGNKETSEYVPKIMAKAGYDSDIEMYQPKDQPVPVAAGLVPEGDASFRNTDLGVNNVYGERNVYSELSTVRPADMLGNNIQSDYQKNFYSKFRSANSQRAGGLPPLVEALDNLYPAPFEGNSLEGEANRRYLTTKEWDRDIWDRSWGEKFMEQVGSSYGMTHTVRAVNWVNSDRENLPYLSDGKTWDFDKPFNYLDYTELETMLPQEDRDYLRKATNYDELGKRWQAIENKGISARAFAESSFLGSLAPSLIGGLADPTYAVTGGIARGVVTKVAQGAGVLKQASVVMGTAGAESAVLDLASKMYGQHITNQEMATNILMAGAFSGVWHGTATGFSVSKQKLQGDVADLMKGKEEIDLHLTQLAQERVGEGASQNAIAKAKDAIIIEEYQKISDMITAEAPDNLRVFKHYDEITPEAQEVWAARAEHHGIPKDVFKGEELRDIVTVFDWAENVLKDHNIDTSHVKSAFEKMGKTAEFIKSPAYLLAQEDNIVARAMTLVIESPVKTTNVDWTTAPITKLAVQKTLTRDMYTAMDDLSGIWAREQGISPVKYVADRLWNDNIRANFYREVYRAGLYKSKHGELPPNTSKATESALANLHGSYQKAAILGRNAKIAGWELLDPNKLYLPRRLNGNMISKLSKNNYEALVQEIKKQVIENEGFSEEVASRFADNYLKRAKDTFNSLNNNLSTNLLSQLDTKKLRLMLEEAGMDELTVKEYLRLDDLKASTNRRSRLDIDFNKKIDTPDGTFDMFDLLDHDIMTQHKSYVNRISGEIGFARFGINGEEQFNAIVQAMTEGNNRASDRAIHAMKQIGAEMYGKPLEGSVRSAVLDTTSSVASTSLFGMLPFTQANESFNILTQMGVRSFNNFIKNVPALHREINMLRKGKIIPESEGGILASLESSSGQVFGMEMFYDQSMFNFSSTITTTPNGETMNVINKSAKALGTLQSKITGYRAISSVQQRGVTEEILLKAVRYAKEGSKEADATLRDFGFSESLLNSLRRNLDNMVSFNKEGRPITFDITKWDNAADANAFLGFVQRGAYGIIQNTFAGESGKWVHNSVTRFLGQLRSFSFVSLEKQLGRQLKTSGMTNTALRFGTLAAGATLIYYARAMARTIGMSEKEREKALDKSLAMGNIVNSVLNSSSLSGVSSDIVNVGAWIASPFYETDKLYGNRAGQTDAIGGMVAPAVSTVNDMISGIKSGDPRKIMSNMPMGRTMYSVILMNSLFPKGD